MQTVDWNWQLARIAKGLTATVLLMFKTLRQLDDAKAHVGNLTKYRKFSVRTDRSLTVASHFGFSATAATRVADFTFDWWSQLPDTIASAGFQKYVWQAHDCTWPFLTKIFSLWSTLIHFEKSLCDRRSMEQSFEGGQAGWLMAAVSRISQGSSREASIGLYRRLGCKVVTVLMRSLQYMKLQMITAFLVRIHNQASLLLYMNIYNLIYVNNSVQPMRLLFHKYIFKLFELFTSQDSPFFCRVLPTKCQCHGPKQDVHVLTTGEL